MDSDNIAANFEKLKNSLWQLPLSFCLVYQIVHANAEPSLKHCKAVSRYLKSSEEYDKLASTYKEIAASCYEYQRNMVLEENLPTTNPQGQRWCGFNVAAESDVGHPPMNTEGQRWWHLVVGTGPTRAAGYVIVARIGARNEREVHDCIAGIQNIMSTK